MCRESDDFANQICLNESRSKMRVFFEKNIGNTVDSDIEILYNISIRYTVYKRTKVRLYAVYLNFNMQH